MFGYVDLLFVQVYYMFLDADEGCRWWFVFWLMQVHKEAVFSRAL